MLRRVDQLALPEIGIVNVHALPGAQEADCEKRNSSSAFHVEERDI